MRSIRRLGVLALSTLVAGAFVAGPAEAGTVESYLGTAAGRGFNLELLGQKLTMGVSTAKVTSALTAVAEGAGALLQEATVTPTAVSGDNTRQEATQKCATPALPDLVASILDVGLACSSSLSEVVNGAPHAVATGSVASLDLNLSTVLNAVPLVNQTIDQVQTALTPVLGTVESQVNTLLPQLNLKPSDTVAQLLDGLQALETLNVRVGSSTSDVSTVANAVTSVATAAGAQIDVLPLGGVIGGVAGGPLLSIIVGDAKARAVYDRVTGASTATFDPALVRVRLGIAGLPTVVPQEIAVPIGQTITLLAGTPLESTISVADGRQVKNADGSLGAVADGVALHLLKGINGGLKLELAHAEAGVAGALAVPDQILPDLPRELPRTGGTPWLPAAGIGLVALAIATRRFVLSR